MRTSSIDVLLLLHKEQDNGLSFAAIGKRLFSTYKEPREGSARAMRELSQRRLVKYHSTNEDNVALWTVTPLGKQRALIELEYRQRLHICEFCARFDLDGKDCPAQERQDPTEPCRAWKDSL